MEGVRAITHFNVYAKRAHSIHGIKIQNQERKKYLFEIWLKRKEDNSLYGNLDKWGYIKRNIHSYDKGNKGKFIQRGDDFTGENISIETKCKKKEVAGIKNSDIDCCIVVENCEDKNSYLYILKVIKSAINLIYPSLTVNIIKASVPIAKIYEEQNNICDISINNTVAIVNTQFVASLCNMDERITIINRIIKYWAKQKNINNRSIERANAASFEINSEYFFLQDEVQMPFYTSIEDIKTKFQNFKKNEEDVSKLLYGFFEFYSNDICKNGITLDIYNNQIIENKDMTANIYCPITKKIVNTYSINTWKKIYDKIHAAYDKLKDGSSLNVICEETKDNTPNRKIDLKDHLLRRKIFQNLCKP
ncbi:nucleotidyltransferase, putative [Plasmodium ovale wallikeri]|uniref:Nucleotidyltransferase, putative n=1 Tax=Plasmodium ovale wallikeri TaxID=864142 RepID=A0A1A9A188_PLAOA|nr:nucleotidyltransferase, putative [Plasmodium ovale wallikeri]